MKHHFIAAVVIILCLLTGCSGNSFEERAEPFQEGEPIITETKPDQEDNSTNPETESLQENKPEITDEELNQLFEKTFDTWGNMQTQELSQITNELSRLRESVDVESLPEDYEERYKERRGERVSNFLEIVKQSKIKRLKEEYNQLILQDSELMSIWNANYVYYGPAGMELGQRPCRADYVDFDGDGIPELLTTAMDYNEYTSTLKIYGNVDGHASKITEKTIDMAGRTYGFDLVKDKNNVVYILFSSSNGNFNSGDYFCYYGLVNNQLIPVDEAYEVFGEPDGHWYSFGNKMTDGQYEALMNKYEFDTELFTGDYQSGVLLTERGFLSDLLAISINIEGSLLNLEDEAFMKNGNIMISQIQPILSMVGIAFYEASSKDTILLSTQNNTLEIYDYGRQWGNLYGEYYMNFDMNYFEDGTMPMLINDKIFYPIDRILELFGIKTAWNAETRILSVVGSIPNDKRMGDAELEKIMDFSIYEAIVNIEKQGYNYIASDMEPVFRFRFGKKYWGLTILPKGTELEYYDDEISSNLLYVEVANDGEIIWK